MPRHIENHNNITIVTGPDLPNFIPQLHIKVLGYFFNVRGEIESQVNSIVSETSALFHLTDLHKGDLYLKTQKS